MSLTFETVQRALQEAGLAGWFPPDRIPPLLSFLERMLSINETLNLTKWTQDQDVLIHHLLDSAHGLPNLSSFLKPSQRWLDLGTGCGFPGVVLAAVHPEMEVTLLDSVRKKTKALETCVSGLGWKVQTLTARAEDVGRNPGTRESWDGVCARAVADLPVLLEYALPLLKPGGYLVNWMTDEQLKTVDRSQKALAVLGGKALQEKEYSLPGLIQKRALLFVEKMGKSPELYPRPVGRPSKEPL